MPKCAINNRVATEQDFHRGEAVFYIPSQCSEPYPFGRDLPILATITKPDGHDGFPPPGTRIQIMQAEKVDGKDILIGFIHGEKDGICMLEDVELDATSPTG